MSTESTIRMISAYNQDAPPTLFLSGQFSSPAENFHTSESVEIDIVRSEEDVSIVITDLSAGYRMNAEDLYTNKRFTPPVHKEAGPLNASDLLKRSPGDDPFKSPQTAATAVRRAFSIFRKTERKIRRAIELQASQVLQTGIITLTDMSGAALYNLDYKPKATHFPTAGTAWDQAAADPLLDLGALAKVIRSDGLTQPTDLIFGSDAWDSFIRNDVVQALLDNRRMELGSVAPTSMAGEGQEFMGWIMVGSYKMNMWTYTGRYKHPVTGVSTEFMSPEKVIMKSAGARLDATFGNIPLIARPEARAMQFLPSRLANVGSGMDLHTNAWITTDNTALMVGAGARPLLIPTAIDSYGCIDTGV